MDEGKAGLRGAENPFPPLAAGMHNKARNALFWCNHDQPRIVSRFGDEGEPRSRCKDARHGAARHAGHAVYLPGEELGMTNPHFSRITDYRDVESLNMFAELRANGREPDELLAILASKSRDNGRTQCSGTRHTMRALPRASRGLGSAITMKP